jgi:hypothetical protein
MLNDKVEILRALNAIWRDGDVREVRTFPDKFVNYGQKTSGYFDSPDSLAGAIAKLPADQYEAIYLTLNSCNSALLARSNNRMQRAPKVTSSDHDMVNCDLLLVDVDPVRPAGVSATDDEKAAAFLVISKIIAKLGAPLLHQDSGNGYHAIYRLSTCDTEEKKAFLQKLDAEFSTEAARVDTKVFNASRIFKLAGTWARKGDQTGDRPHRMARVLSVNAGQIPLSLPPVPVAAVLLPAVRAESAVATRALPDVGSDRNSELVRDLLAHEGVSFREKDKNGAHFFCLDACVFDTNHQDNDAAVVVNGTGMITYQCFHNGCSRNTWHDVKDLFPAFFEARAAAKAKAKPGRPRKKDGEKGDDSKSRYPRQSDWDALFHEKEWRFAIDELTHEILLNRQPLQDVDWAWLRRVARDWLVSNGLRRDMKDFEDAVLCTARATVINDIKEYLEALKWDGVDRITELAEHFQTDMDFMFPRMLEIWLSHSIARIYTPVRSLCLVLQGGQEIGKSHFARWLCPLDTERFFNESDIRPDDKDCKIRSAYVWIWELAELDKTTRKADASALKNFISATSFKERKPFGRTDENYKPISSFLGTVNPDIFLVDQTGNSRFIVVKTTGINWDYTKIDKNQLWAQAVQCWKDGKNVMSDSERELRNSRNEQAMTAWSFEQYLDHALSFDPTAHCTMPEILSYLSSKNINLARNNELVAYLKKRGFERGRRRTESGNFVAVVKGAHLNTFLESTVWQKNSEYV